MKTPARRGPIFGDIARVPGAITCAALGWVVLCHTAAAQVTKAEAATNIVTYVSAYMEHCTLIDALVRKTCGRMGHHFPEKDKRFCELPAQSFESRTERAYQAWKGANQEAIKANEAAIAKAVQLARRTFERQFSRVIGGQVSMLEFESLSGELKDRCSVVGNEWLRAQAPR